MGAPPSSDFVLKLTKFIPKQHTKVFLSFKHQFLLNLPNCITLHMIKLSNQLP